MRLFVTLITWSRKFKEFTVMRRPMCIVLMKGLNITSYERQGDIGSRRCIKQSISMKDFNMFRRDILYVAD